MICANVLRSEYLAQVDVCENEGIERRVQLVDQGWKGVAVCKVRGQAGRVDSLSFEFRDQRGRAAGLVSNRPGAML